MALEVVNPLGGRGRKDLIHAAIRGGDLLEIIFRCNFCMIGQWQKVGRKFRHVRDENVFNGYAFPVNGKGVLTVEMSSCFFRRIKLRAMLP